MSSRSSNNGDNDAWLMKIELKREEPMGINKDEGIKKATDDQVPATEDILQLEHDPFFPANCIPHPTLIRYIMGTLPS